MVGETTMAPHQAGQVEEVDLSEIMAIMRSPEKLEEAGTDVGQATVGGH